MMPRKMALVQRVLRNPGAWNQVLAIADALEQHGNLDFEEGDYLPAHNRQWPSAPPRIKSNAAA